MDILELMLSRRSYRGTYTVQKVPRSDLVKIMEGGLAAPSGCNKQTSSLIAVDDPEMLRSVKSVIVPSVAETVAAPKKKAFCWRTYTEEREALRQSFNDWLRSSDDFDG